MMNCPNPNITVRIQANFQYPVVFTENVFAADNPALANILDAAREELALSSDQLRLRVFVDAGLAAAQPDLLPTIEAYGKALVPELAMNKPTVLPGGEAIKNSWTYVHRVLADITEHRLCRHSFVIAIGGGAFLDAIGFAAALLHRGVRLIRLPSTTLSQDDSGVGTKNGINDAGQKNLLGTFAPPYAVINDFRLLRTLSPELIADGIAEAFKVAIIKDAEFFDYLCEHASALKIPDGEELRHAVRRSAELHMNHIMTSGDPFEMGDARPLDFGHWAAHRLECLSDYKIRHGQAVAIGLALDSLYAVRKGLLEAADAKQICQGLQDAGLKLWTPLLEHKAANGTLAVIEGLEQFREHLGGRLCVTFPNGLGNKIELTEIDHQLLSECLRELKELTAE